MRKFFIILIIIVSLTGILGVKRYPKLFVSLLDSKCDSLHFNIFIDNKNIFDKYVKNNWYTCEEIDFSSHFGKHNVKIIIEDKYVFEKYIFILFNDNILMEVGSNQECSNISFDVNNLRLKKPIFEKQWAHVNYHTIRR